MNILYFSIKFFHLETDSPETLPTMPPANIYFIRRSNWLLYFLMQIVLFTFSLRSCWEWIAALLNALGRSHCPCTAIRLGKKFRCCHQRGRTGSSVLWLCKSHCRGIGSQRDRRFHCFPLLGTSGSPEREDSGVRGLLRRPQQDRSALA